jgi:hypothetical protein
MGRELYQNETLGFLHAVNPTLAAKVASTKPEDIDQRTLQRINQAVIDGGWNPTQLAAMGYAALTIQDFQGATFKDPASAQGPTRVMPDPEKVRQTARDLYRTLFLTEPDEATLGRLVSGVQAAVQAQDIDSTDGVVSTVDQDAQLRKMLESDPRYKELYGKMPAGATEAEYRGQFDAAAQSILGNQLASPDSVRAGMRTGDYNTTVGAAAMSRQATESSTFLGRLASAAQVVNRMT